MRFFLDNCLALAHAKALGALAAHDRTEVVHLSDKFPRDAKDVEWIAGLAKESGWIIVSGDERIRRNPVERKAWEESGLTVFFLLAPFEEMSFWNQSLELVRWWPAIAHTAKAHPTAHGFLLPVKGKAPQRCYPK